MIPIVPQRTHGTTTRDDPEPHAKTGQSRDDTYICGRYSTAWHYNGTGSLPTSAGYLAKNDVQTMAYSAGGATALILLSLREAQLFPELGFFANIYWHEQVRSFGTAHALDEPHTIGWRD